VKQTPLKRKTPLKRGTKGLKRGAGIQGQSEQAKVQAVERSRNLLEAFGYKPDCAGWTRIPVCPIYRHSADDGHEPRRRSQGADPTNPAEVIPLCRAAHDWVHDNPKAASERTTADGRPFLALPSS
jgi:hypothetical protein